MGEAPKSLEQWCAEQQSARAPIALILAEDSFAVAETLAHARRIGFTRIAVFADEAEIGNFPPSAPVVTARLDNAEAVRSTLNAALASLIGSWVSYFYNGEFLYFPFWESRTIGDVTRFLDEERRMSAFATVVDLYPEHLPHSEAEWEQAAHLFDRLGYYSRDLTDENGAALERQVEVFGGLRRRFSEHVPYHKRRADRVGLFKVLPGVQMDEAFRLSDPELNTIACPWHHNLTVCFPSYRAARALWHNPGSRTAIGNLRWHGSEAFDASSRQMMEHGLIEPGQWL